MAEPLKMFSAVAGGMKSAILSARDESHTSMRGRIGNDREFTSARDEKPLPEVNQAQNHFLMPVGQMSSLRQ